MFDIEKRKQKGFKNKKAMAIFILKHISKKNKAVEFGPLFLELLPNNGIEAFQDLLDEMVEKKWLLKKEEPTGSIPGFPHLVTTKMTYNISLDGVAYIESQKSYNVVLNFLKQNTKATVSISGVLGLTILGSTYFSQTTVKDNNIRVDTTVANKPVTFNDSMKFNITIKK